MTVVEIYERAIKPLPPSERLRLATLILNGISPGSVADYADAWSDEDLADFTGAGWARGEQDANG